MVRYLDEIEVEADTARNAALHTAGDERTAEYQLIREMHNLVGRGDADKVNWVKVARTQLCRRKRAANLADSLRAVAVFEEADLDDKSARAARVALDRRRQARRRDRPAPHQA